MIVFCQSGPTIKLCVKLIDDPTFIFGRFIAIVPCYIFTQVHSILSVTYAKKKSLAERGFDPRTSGLWAQHASTAPLCCWSKRGRTGVFLRLGWLMQYTHTYCILAFTRCLCCVADWRSGSVLGP